MSKAPKSEPQATELPREGSINEPPGSMVIPGGGPNDPNALPDMPTPVITGLTPDACVIGDADFTLYVSGEGFIPQVSMIHFAGHDEPTKHEDDGTLSTGVKPSLWASPVEVEVMVKNGAKASDPVMFSFDEAASRSKRRR